MSRGDGPDLEYWKALAEERRLELDRLRARLHRTLESVPDSHFERILATIDGRDDGWMGEIRRLESSAKLEQTDILSTLDDLWIRVAAGRTP